jgi:hypothetical protein
MNRHHAPSLAVAGGPVHYKGEARGWAAARRGEEKGERPRVAALIDFDPSVATF